METIENIKLRSIIAEDITPISQIIEAIGVDEFVRRFQARDWSAVSGSTEQLGMIASLDLVAVILTNLPSCMDKVFTWVASVCQTEEAVIRKLPLGQFAQVLGQIVESDDFVQVFNVASRLFK